MNVMPKIIILVISLFAISCNELSKRGNSADDEDDIYFGGYIITMESNSATYAEAVAIKDGKIIFAGSKAEAEKMKGDSTVMNDLKGKTLFPGFIDGHAHFGGFPLQVRSPLISKQLNVENLGV